VEVIGVIKEDIVIGLFLDCGRRVVCGFGGEFCGFCGLCWSFVEEEIEDLAVACYLLLLVLTIDFLPPVYPVWKFCLSC